MKALLTQTSRRAKRGALAGMSIATAPISTPSAKLSEPPAMDARNPSDTHTQAQGVTHRVLGERESVGRTKQDRRQSRERDRETDSRSLSLSKATPQRPIAVVSLSHVRTRTTTKNLRAREWRVSRAKEGFRLFRLAPLPRAATLQILEPTVHRRPGPAVMFF